MQAADLDILVVDDLALVRTLTSEVLRAAGCGRVREAVNAADAVARMSERAGNVLLTDFAMPGGDGVALIATLRAERRYDRCAMILVTGCASDATASAARHAGADAVLPKPIEVADLLSAIETAVAARLRGGRAAIRS
ncbi:response regulator [Terricaulis sp.]|uniref:response regulator n=1 Tax=Terricaulis sp. TaxID=2768686 RepID=UPI0037839D12